MAAEKDWVLRPIFEVPIELAREIPNPYVQQRLVSLNICDVQSAQAYMDPHLYQATSAVEIPDIEKAAMRIAAAIDKGEEIGVWGDFDVDGQTSTTLLVQALQILGKPSRYHIPDRASESHGIRIPFLEKFVEEHTDLLITCDTGISEFEAIEWANQHGIDVIVSDHHALPDRLPAAFALINPQRLPFDHPLHDLAGVGVAFKLMEQVFRRRGMEGHLTQLLDLVALGTIADVAKLSAENHFLAQLGLMEIRQHPRPLLQEIFRIKKIEPANLDESHLSFYVAPLMNALGRLGNATDMVSYLLSTNLQEVRVFATVLDNLNERRKLISEQILMAANQQIHNEPNLLNQPALVLHNSEWTAGVLGIVASRLVEMYSVPVFLLTGDLSDVVKGSGRSLQNLNLIQAVGLCASQLLHFGGHAMAAGLSLRGENLNSFKRGFTSAIMLQSSGVRIRPQLEIDSYLDLENIDLNFIKNISKLAPFGAGNPQFTFATRAINIQKVNKFGNLGKHVRLSLDISNRNSLDVVWWSGAEDVIEDSVVDIAYQLQPDTYKNKEGVQLKEIMAMRLAESEKQAILTQANQMQVIDLRMESSIPQSLLSDNSNMVIWAEGMETDLPGSVDRLNLHPSDSIFIYTSPPNLIELAKAWKIVSPKTIYLGGVIPPTDSVNRVLQITLGMVKFAIQNNFGFFDIRRAAARSAQRNITIMSALQYLSASGIINYNEHPDAGITVSTPGNLDRIRQKLAETTLRYHLRETSTFRKYYLQMDPQLLMNEILSQFSTK